jgi:hypothetical protein
LITHNFGTPREFAPSRGLHAAAVAAAAAAAAAALGRVKVVISCVGLDEASSPKEYRKAVLLTIPLTTAHYCNLSVQL